jgi:regulator of ribonuclease activity A
MLGDLLAQKGVDNGWAGVVMYGCIRDSVDIGQMPIGVKAMATIPKKSVKKGAGERAVAVRFAQVEFRPGDRLYADEDGIVVLPKDKG